MPQCQLLFSAIFVFSKSYTGNLLRIGWDKSQSSYFYRAEDESKTGARAARPALGAAYPGPAPRPAEAASWLFSVSPLDYVFMSEKIGGLAFVSSNSENISCTTFLKHKNSRKQELALRHLVNRLVPENA